MINKNADTSSLKDIFKEYQEKEAGSENRFIRLHDAGARSN